MNNRSFKIKANIFYILTFIGLIEFITEETVSQFFINIPEECGVICYIFSNLFYLLLGKNGLLVAAVLFTFIKSLFILFLIGSIYFWSQSKKDRNK
jgi:hypothetical protein